MTHTYLKHVPPINNQDERQTQMTDTKTHTTPQPAQAMQAEVTDDVSLDERFRDWIVTIKDAHDNSLDGEHASSRSMLRGVIYEMEDACAILALRPAAVPMTDEVFDLICNAIDKADTITMEGDYMLDSDDCIAVVRVMQALLSVHHGITAQAKKEDGK